MDEDEYSTTQSAHQNNEGHKAVLIFLEITSAADNGPPQFGEPLPCVYRTVTLCRNSLRGRLRQDLINLRRIKHFFLKKRFRESF